MANYFHIREMQCRDGTPYPDRWRESRWVVLRRVLNRIRNAWGEPIRVTSGYRTPSYNRSVGGVKRSQHVQGRAADLVPDGGTWRVPALHAFILGMYRAGELPELKGLGEYSSFVHVDVRPSKRLRRWRG